MFDIAALQVQLEGAWVREGVSQRLAHVHHILGGKKARDGIGDRLTHGGDLTLLVIRQAINIPCGPGEFPQSRVAWLAVDRIVIRIVDRVGLQQPVVHLHKAGVGIIVWRAQDGGPLAGQPEVRQRHAWDRHQPGMVLRTSQYAGSHAAQTTQRLPLTGPGVQPRSICVTAQGGEIHLTHLNPAELRRRGQGRSHLEGGPPRFQSPRVHGQPDFVWLSP